MSMSAALSIFAPPSGLAPSGGQVVSGADGLFADLLQAETAGTEASVVIKATPSVTPPVDRDLPALPIEEGETATAATDVVAADVVPVVQTDPIAPQVVAVAPNVEAGPVAASDTLPVSPEADAEGRAEPSPRQTRQGAVAQDTATEAAGPVARAVERSLTPTATPTVSPVGPKPVPPSKAEAAIAVALPIDAAPPADTAPKATTPALPAERPVTALPRAALETRLTARPRDVAAARAPVMDTQASAVASEDPTSDIVADPAIGKAVRVVPGPAPVSQPPVAPALVTAVQGQGNAAAGAQETVTSDIASSAGSDRAAATVKAPAAAAPAPATSATVAPPPAEVVPLATAAPQARPDPVPEARVETPQPEAAPATPASVNTSSLSRASIETTALLAAQIARRLEGRSTRFDMALTPEGLGRVDVRVEIDADGQLAARLAFDNPAAATELRGRADELRRQLEDAGFTLSGDALEFSDRDSSSGGQGAFERQQRRAAYAHCLSSEPDLSAVPAAWSPRPGTPRGVDVKV